MNYCYGYDPYGIALMFLVNLALITDVEKGSVLPVLPDSPWIDHKFRTTGSNPYVQ